MKKNKIYYLLLGIGLGIIITSSLNIVFTKEEKIEYTDEEIREKAKALGMISIKENIEKNDKEKNEKKKDLSQNIQKTNSKSNQITDNQTESQAKAQTGHKLIVIELADTANSIIHKLKLNGIIENEKEFKDLVAKHSLQTKFISGTYEIKENSTYEEVLKKLIKENELKKAGFYKK